MRDALYVIADIPKAMELDSYDPDSKTWIGKAGCYIIEASLTYREMTMIESVANRALVLIINRIKNGIIERNHWYRSHKVTVNFRDIIIAFVNTEIHDEFKKTLVIITSALKEKGYCVRCNNYDIAVEW